MNNQYEQRNLKRHQLIYSLQVFDGESSRLLGNIIDLTCHGLMLRCKDPLAPQEEYRFRIKLPVSLDIGRELRFDATCRWCRTDQYSEFFVAGFKIKVLNPSLKKMLENLLHHLS